MEDKLKPETEETIPEPQEQTPEETAAQPEEAAAPSGKTPRFSKSKKAEAELKALQEKLDTEHEAHLRLAAEYDNFRKRTQKEKDASYANGKADTVAKLLPIYDNLERALNQPTEDSAYKKGVEMTMNELVKAFAGLGAEAFGAVGDTFDPNFHNAIMHTEDESLGENVISQVFQRGFKLSDKVIRFAMVQVAN